LPFLDRIDPGQADWFGYNPSISGINLNFNRVNFVWKRQGDGYEVGMNAEGERFVPEVHTARVSVVERETPLFTYAGDGEVEEWTVARPALGKGGSRWLPVRRPEAYTGDVFQTLARAHGIDLPSPRAGDAAPTGGTVVLERSSDDLRRLLTDMLKFSTNLTAEVVGMSASQMRGVAGHGASGRAMTAWVRERADLTATDLTDHSGLGPGSRMTAQDMVRMLVRLGQPAGLRSLMRQVTFKEKGEKALSPGIRVEAKTGTLNFVSALAGYMTARDGTDLAFAIFTGDAARRDAVPAEQRDEPEGARDWTRRSKRLQAQLIERWAELYGS
jgi:D-alanyl-D-alanine carboxypeptidase/D-alanyl-D-alanine-endopeptidase (penicillin-binding protein 4)